MKISLRKPSALKEDVPTAAVMANCILRRPTVRHDTTPTTTATPCASARSFFPPCAIAPPSLAPRSITMRGIWMTAAVAAVLVLATAQGDACPAYPTKCPLAPPNGTQGDAQLFHDVCMTDSAGAEPPINRCLPFRWNDTKPGVFTCGCCGQPLFTTDHIYDAGTGWPAFNATVKDAVCVVSPGTESRCSKCGAHLGDFFPPLHYCIGKNWWWLCGGMATDPLALSCQLLGVPKADTHANDRKLFRWSLPAPSCRIKFQQRMRTEAAAPFASSPPASSPPVSDLFPVRRCCVTLACRWHRSQQAVLRRFAVCRFVWLHGCLFQLVQPFSAGAVRCGQS